jgi:purine nucleoside permease
LAKGWGVDEARRAVGMIGADALFLHMNPIQEAAQGGDVDFRGLVPRIKALCSAMRAEGIPVFAREVGFGVSADAAKRLVDAGIAGIDPADGTLGSAVWANSLVEGDLGYEIDAREIPDGWPTGYLPYGRYEPYAKPRKDDKIGEVYHLQPGLVDWAYQLTKDISLDDNPEMLKRRTRYDGFPNAQRPPFVLKGDNLASSTFWHGKLLNQWANDWVAYHTEGRGNYVTTAMEDTGTLQALTWLSRAGKTDVKRVLVLRTASNFDMQWPEGTALASLSGEQDGPLGGYLPSVEAAYKVGSRVVSALLKGWDCYATELPKP